MAAAISALTLEEYMRTSYEWEPEFVDGELVERSMPTTTHSKSQDNIQAGVRRSSNSTRLGAYPAVRLRVGPRRVRIPDLSLFADSRPADPYPESAPLAVIEIISQDDVYNDLVAKCDDYLAFGVQYVWLVDTVKNRIFRYDGNNLIRVDALEIPERGFHIPAADVFAR